MYNMVCIALVKSSCVGGIKHEVTPLDIAFQERVILPAGDILQYRKRFFFDGQLGVVRKWGAKGSLAYKSGDCL